MCAEGESGELSILPVTVTATGSGEDKAVNVEVSPVAAEYSVSLNSQLKGRLLSVCSQVLVSLGRLQSNVIKHLFGSWGYVVQNQSKERQQKLLCQKSCKYVPKYSLWRWGNRWGICVNCQLLGITLSLGLCNAFHCCFCLSCCTVAVLPVKLSLAQET